MNEAMRHSSYILGLRGVVAVLFGALALVLPGMTLLSLVALFAVYALIGGAVTVFLAVRNRTRDEHWWLPMLWGLISIGAGLIAAMHPAQSALLLVLIIGANALVTGVLDIVNAVRLRKEITGEWLLALNGLISIAFGALVFIFPGTSALALVWAIGIYALVTGMLLLGAAFKLHAMSKETSSRERRVNPDRRISRMPG